MKFDTLDTWLAWQETLHPAEIDLGLGRVADVLGRMGRPSATPLVITVGGTNGKGSSVAMLAAILMAAGFRVGAYTSPHLLSYNERICVSGQAVSDEQLCQAFERVDQARGNTSLSYFEFGTLAALDIFYQMSVDVMILEVGLGGRLDAVNVLDADMALVTSIDYDHMDWLGDDREQIGWEKAGIFRSHQVAVCGDSTPPQRLLDHAKMLQTDLSLVGKDYGYQRADNETGGWSWWNAEHRYDELPRLGVSGSFQYHNSASVLQLIDLLPTRFEVSLSAIKQGLASVAIQGRFQLLAGEIPTILDVAHNPLGARALAQALADMPCCGRTRAVFSMLIDKDIAAVVDAIHPVIDDWSIAALDVARGASSEDLLRVIQRAAGDGRVLSYDNIEQAYQAARQQAAAADRIVVFGSFYTVAKILALNNSGDVIDELGYSC